MEPVQIDFLYGGNTQTEGPKIEQSMQNIVAASKSSVQSVQDAGKAAIDSVKGQIDKTKESVQNLEKLVDGLKKKMADAAPGNSKQSAILDFNEANRSLNNQKTILSGLEQQRNSLIATQKQQIGANKEEENSHGGLVSSLGKWFVGIMSVGAALQIGKRIMESTESTSHALERATEQVSSAVGYMFKTIASGDWSNFTEGIARAIQGAKDYVDALEVIENKKNEQKIKSSSLDIQIGQARADSYSTDPKVVKEALKRIITLQTQKLTEEADIARQSYELKRKKVADDNNWNETELQNTIRYYTKNKKLIETGEKYNELKSERSAVVQTRDSYGGEKRYQQNIDETNSLIAAAKKEGINLQQAGRVAMNFAKVAFPQRNELADLLAKSQDATAAININNRRDKQRLVGIEKKEQDDAIAADKKAQDEKNKRIKEQLEYTTEIGRKRIANELEIEQQLLNAETDGAEKSRKQADLDYRKKLSDIEIQKAEFIKKQNLISGGIDKATGKPTAKYSDVIPKADQKQFEGLADAALKVRDSKLTEVGKKEQKRIDDLLKMAEKYSDERVKIEVEYNERIRAVDNLAADPKSTSKVVADAKKLSAALAIERDEKISAVSTKLLEETDLYKMATGKQLQISKELTAALIAELEKRIEADQTITSEDADKMLAKLHQADYTVQKTDNPFADLIDGVAKYKSAREDQSKINAQDDIEGFAKMEDAANKAQKATLEAAAGALQGISSIIRQVSDEISGLTDAEKKSVNQVIGMISGAATLAQGLATGNPIAIIQGSIELATNAYRLFDKESKAIEKRIANNEIQVDALTKAYENLGVAIKNAYGTDKIKLLDDELAILQEQRKAIEDSKSAEMAKDKPLKWYEYLSPAAIAGHLLVSANQKEIDQYNKDLDEIAKKEQENKDARVEALTGTSVMTAIDEFANAYADAFTSGEDAALKSADIIKNILKTALLESLKNDLKPGITELMNMVGTAMSDGILSADEKAKIEIKKKELDAEAKKKQGAFDELGLNDSTNAKQKGIQGDVKNMTEETGSALTGQIVAMRLNVSALLANSKSSVDIMGKQLATLEEIKNNTAFCRKLERMDETLYYIKQNGIKVQ